MSASSLDSTFGSRYRNYPAAILLCVALLLQGCEDPGKTPIATTAGGAAVGAGIGALVGGAKGSLIGAGAGAALGLLAGAIVYKEQKALEAQKAASRASVDEAESVLKRYRDYNKYLEGFVKDAQAAANNISTGSYTPEQLAEAKAKASAQIDKATAGAHDSLAAFDEWGKKVDAAQSSTQDEAERQKLLATLAAKEALEKQLSDQLDQLTTAREQIAAK